LSVEALAKTDGEGGGAEDGQSLEGNSGEDRGMSVELQQTEIGEFPSAWKVDRVDSAFDIQQEVELPAAESEFQGDGNRDRRDTSVHPIGRDGDGRIGAEGDSEWRGNLADERNPHLA
jgi:hypothetical protein